MTFRRPTLLTAAFGLLALSILIGLGAWQWERRGWKAELLATIDARLAEPVEPLPADTPRDWELRRVEVQGTVVGGQWFRFPVRSRDGRVGDALMLLLRLDDGRLIAVEHDWVPFNADLPPLPLALAVMGVLRWPVEPGWFTPENDPAANQWYHVLPGAMAAEAGIAAGDAAPYYLRPIGWRPDLPNNHLQYALTWWGLAAVFVVVFVAFHRRGNSAS